jgi:hypothetical protein
VRMVAQSCIGSTSPSPSESSESSSHLMGGSGASPVGIDGPGGDKEEVSGGGSAAIVLVDGVGEMSMASSSMSWSTRGRHWRLRRAQSPHEGFISSHFFRRRRQLTQPFEDLEWRALLLLGKLFGLVVMKWGPSIIDLGDPLSSPDRRVRLQGSWSLRHLAHGTWPVHLALMAAHFWQAVGLRPMSATKDRGSSVSERQRSRVASCHGKGGFDGGWKENCGY